MSKMSDDLAKEGGNIDVLLLVGRRLPVTSQAVVTMGA